MKVTFHAFHDREETELQVQTSTQAFSSRSLDSTSREMSWRHRMVFGGVTSHDIWRQVESREREESAWVLVYCKMH